MSYLVIFGVRVRAAHPCIPIRVQCPYSCNEKRCPMLRVGQWEDFARGPSGPASITFNRLLIRTPHSYSYAFNLSPTKADEMLALSVVVVGKKLRGERRASDENDGSAFIATVRQLEKNSE